jgi:SpoVK/Ycf46/Vps4 family AAA+-type ATPase
VIVLAATNRPFDLDDAVLRRMPRRLMVDLPDAENRQKIIKVILAKEDLAPGFDFKAVADITEGFSGSDLKNLCIAAAYIPIREILDKEKDAPISVPVKKMKKSKKGKEKVKDDDTETKFQSETGKDDDDLADDDEDEEDNDAEDDEDEDEDSKDEPEERETPFIRPLVFSDFEKAKKELSASVHEDARAIAELRKWNEMYGEGGSGRPNSLTYFM